MASFTKRATIYFDPEIHHILKLKALETDRSISDIVDESIRLELAEDAEDLQSIKEREKETTITYEELISDLKAHGKI